QWLQGTFATGKLPWLRLIVVRQRHARINRWPLTVPVVTRNASSVRSLVSRSGKCFTLRSETEAPSNHHVPAVPLNIIKLSDSPSNFDQFFIFFALLKRSRPSYRRPIFRDGG